jgi:hypothetical protein
MRKFSSVKPEPGGLYALGDLDPSLASVLMGGGARLDGGGLVGASLTMGEY